MNRLFCRNGKKMKKQIDGQINLFEYISEEEKSSNVEIVQNQDILISYYKECSSCWCSTCSHNGKGKAVPRDFAGEQKPCPSCDYCISQKKAEICEIGSYENGCKLRAEEEGIIFE